MRVLLLLVALALIAAAGAVVRHGLARWRDPALALADAPAAEPLRATRAAALGLWRDRREVEREVRGREEAREATWERGTRESTFRAQESIDRALTDLHRRRLDLAAREDAAWRDLCAREGMRACAWHGDGVLGKALQALLAGALLAGAAVALKLRG